MHAWILTRDCSSSRVPAIAGVLTAVFWSDSGTDSHADVLFLLLVLRGLQRGGFAFASVRFRSRCIWCKQRARVAI